MKTLMIFLAAIGLTAAAWAGQGEKQGGMHHKKHHFGKMMFKKMDQNNDGAISLKEHEAGLQKMLDRRRAHFAMMDKDGDGLVTREEAREAKKEMEEKWKEKRQKNNS